MENAGRESVHDLQHRTRLTPAELTRHGSCANLHLMNIQAFPGAAMQNSLISDPEVTRERLEQFARYKEELEKEPGK